MIYPFALPATHEENLWRHYWHRQMRRAGGFSLLPILPLELVNGTDVVPLPPPPPAPLDEIKPKPNGGGNRHERRAARKITRVLRSRKLPEPEQEDDHDRPPLATRTQFPGAPAVDDDDPPNDVLFHHDIGDVLECLDDYFLWLKRLRQYHPDAYDMHSRIGGVVVPSSEWTIPARLAVEGHKTPSSWPANIMISLPEKGTDPRPGYVSSKMFVYSKVASGSFVPKGTVFYECMILFTERVKRKGSEGNVCFYVGFDDNGHGEALAYPLSRAQVLHNGKAKGQIIYHRETGYGPGVKDITDNFNKEFGTNYTVHEHLTYTLLHGIAMMRSMEGGATVNIYKGGLVGRFGVPATRTSHFFRDRELPDGEGRRKPIFHQVREYSYPHYLTGREVRVGTHYRGLTERRFEWRGYQVCITVPDYHHRRWSAFKGAMQSVESGVPLRPDEIDAKELASRVHGHIWESPDRPAHGEPWWTWWRN